MTRGRRMREGKGSQRIGKSSADNRGLTNLDPTTTREVKGDHHERNMKNPKCFPRTPLKKGSSKAAATAIGKNRVTSGEHQRVNRRGVLEEDWDTVSPPKIMQRKKKRKSLGVGNPRQEREMGYQAGGQHEEKRSATHFGCRNGAKNRHVSSSRGMSYHGPAQGGVIRKCGQHPIANWKGPKKYSNKGWGSGKTVNGRITGRPFIWRYARECRLSGEGRSSMVFWRARTMGGTRLARDGQSVEIIPREACPGTLSQSKGRCLRPRGIGVKNHAREKIRTDSASRKPPGCKAR